MAPDIVRISKDELLMGYSRATNHTSTDAHIVLRRSFDNGRSWESEFVLTSTAGSQISDPANPERGVQLNYINGRLYLRYNVNFIDTPARRANGCNGRPWREVRWHTSDDLGDHWTQAFVPYRAESGCQDFLTSEGGTRMEFWGGKWRDTYYATKHGDQCRSIRYVTWDLDANGFVDTSHFSQMTIAKNCPLSNGHNGSEYNEPVLCHDEYDVLAPRRVLIMHDEIGPDGIDNKPSSSDPQENKIYILTSLDDGETFTTPVNAPQWTGLYGTSNPKCIIDANGAIQLTFRNDTELPLLPSGRPPFRGMLARSPDGGTTWFSGFLFDDPNAGTYINGSILEWAPGVFGMAWAQEFRTSAASTVMHFDVFSVSEYIP
jgi:hypothetical protein